MVVSFMRTGKIFNRVIIPAAVVTVAALAAGVLYAEHRIFFWSTICIAFFFLSITVLSIISCIIENKNKIINKLLWHAENSVEGIYQVSADGIFEYLNPAMVDLLGYNSADEIIGKRLGRFEVSAESSEFKSFLDTLFSEGQAGRSRLELINSEGWTIPVLENAKAIKDSSGSVTGWQGCVYDLRKDEELRKKYQRSEKLFSRLINSADELVAVVSSDKVCLKANNVFAQFFGLNSVELCEGRLFVDLLPPLAAEEFICAVEKVLNNELAVEDFDMVMPDCRSRKRFFTVRMSLCPGEIEKENLVVFLARDVTARIEAEQKAAIAIEQAEDAAEFKLQLAEQFNHELRTPLSGITGAFEVLKASSRNSDAEKCADRGILATKRLNEVYNDILMMTDDSDSDSDVLARRIDLSECIRSVYESFDLYAAGKKLDFKIESRDVPEYMYCNRRRLKLSLFRLTGHILSSLPEENNAFFVVKKASSYDGCNALEFFFTDTNNIFDQADYENAFPRDFEGLADAISAELFIREHKGTREIGFKIGCISFLSGSEHKGCKNTEQIKRILVAEDDINSQARMRIQLEKWGYSVRCVSTGFEVLNCIREDYFDLLLLDIQMPEMDGIRALKKIRKKEDSGSRLPVVCMSAYREDVDNIMDIGADYFLAKPIEANALKDLLNSVFE